MNPHHASAHRRVERIVERLLATCLPPAPVGPSILGDLREEFRRGGGVANTARYVAVALALALRYAPARSAAAAARDLRDAWRGLRRRPAFLFTAAGLLAVGLAATSTVFSFAHAVLLRPLPHVAELDRVVQIQERRDRARPGANTLHNLTRPDIERILARSPSLAAASGMAPGGDIPYTSGEGAERIAATRVGGTFFDIIGAAPLWGRTIAPDDVTPSAQLVVVLSYGGWQRHFGGSMDARGATMTLNGRVHQVIGAMPQGFTFPAGADVYVPMTPSPFTDRFHVVTAIARLAPDATIERASQEAEAVIAGLRATEPDADHGAGVRVVRWRDATTESVRPALRILATAAALVLLLVTGNLGALLLARTAEREHELVVRRNLGATRARIVRLLVAEGALVGVAGAAIAGVLTAATLRFAVAISPADIPFRDAVRVDWSVLSFTALIAITVGIAAALLPAMFTSGARVLRTRAGVSASITRVGRALVVGQLAVATVLLATSGLLLRSFTAALDVDTGMRIDGVLSGDITLPRTYDQTRQAMALNGILDSLRARPDVVGAELAMFPPLRGAIPSTIAFEDPTRDGVRARVSPVTAGYLPLLGVPMVGGRGFEPTDDRPGARRVALVNRAGAEQLWPGESPLERRIVYSGNAYRIVGVTENVKHESLMEPEQTPVLYIPFTAVPFGSGSFVVATRADPAPVARALRSIARQLEPMSPLDNVQTLASIMHEDVAQPRFFLATVGTFAVLALGVALAGLYAVVAFGVRSRMFELGVRSALGATSSQNLWMILRQGLVLCALGAGIGALLSLQATPLLQDSLFDTAVTDPAAYAGAIIAATLTGLLAVLSPALRAARVDPASSLRRD